MINYQFNKELQILEVSYEGDIGLDEIIEFGDLVYTDPGLPRDLKILTDATTARYTLTHSELKDLINLLAVHVKAYHSIKAAYIQTQPRETAYSYIVEMEAKLPNYYHAVFSTRQAAINWLLLKK
jgi:hypothetical protein